MKGKSFLEAAKSLATDYDTGAIVHLQNKDGGRISPKLEVFMADEKLQTEWTVVCVQVAAPVVASKSVETKPQIREEGATE